VSVRPATSHARRAHDSGRTSQRKPRPLSCTVTRLRPPSTNAPLTGWSGTPGRAVPIARPDAASHRRVVQPASQTRRLACAIEQRVLPAREHALEEQEVARDDARGLRAQELAPALPEDRGARSSPAQASTRRIVEGDTRTPSLASSPLIRPWPQRGFSRATRSTTARTSAGMRGRPRRRGGWRLLRRTNARCQRSSVRGVTTWRPPARSRSDSSRRSLSAASARATPGRPVHERVAV
jgi:hypothetical protein